MAQMIRCPLTGAACGRPIDVVEKTFFLAEPKEPTDARQRREQAINLALGDQYKVRSALEEKKPYAFTCKICEMIQGCSYGIADLTGERPNVVLELGIMIALGKQVIMLRKKDEKGELELPSNVKAMEAVPFDEYIDIIDDLKKMAATLLPPVSPTTPIAEIEKLRPLLAEELRKESETVIEAFDRIAKEAKLETLHPREERGEIPPDLERRLGNLEESLKSLGRLGFTTDATTAFYRGNFYYKRQEYEAALEQYDWALTLKPDFLEALTNRGATYDRLERYEEALADLNRALELIPDELFALNNRGIAYSHLDRYDEALADLNNALQVTPDLPPTLYNIACVFSLWRKPEDAISYLEKAIALDGKIRQRAATDSDFDNIRDDPRFQELIEGS